MKTATLTYTLAAVIGGIFLSAVALAAERTVSVEINKGEMVRLERPASSVVIADPNTADVQVVSPKMIYVRGKKVGETSIYAVDDQDETVLNATIEVTHNLSKLEETVKRVAPNADVGFRTVDGGLVLEGFASSPEESANIGSVAQTFLGANEKMVNMLTTNGSDQVMLQVKIVEMTRSDAKRFGINMQNMFPGGNGFTFQLLQGADIEIDTDGELNDTLTEVDRLGLIDRSGGTGTVIGGRWHNGQMTNLIDAMESQGLVSVLAEPTLTTTSGKAASFLAGGEFPIPFNSGNGTISVEYKPFGVSLKFTPIVLSKERISLTVSPEVSTISANNTVQTDGINNPIINTRKAEATLEMGSGDSFALAGLLKSDNANNIDKFPGLGDVPVLGTLFRSTQFQNNQSELIILVTPYIVRPVSNQKMALPTDGYVPPNDFQTLLFGNLYQQEPIPAEENTTPSLAPKLRGEGGFILE